MKAESTKIQRIPTFKITFKKIATYTCLQPMQFLSITGATDLNTYLARMIG